jgi:hypothetical protein
MQSRFWVAEGLPGGATIGMLTMLVRICCQLLGSGWLNLMACKCCNSAESALTVTVTYANFARSAQRLEL